MRRRTALALSCVAALITAGLLWLPSAAGANSTAGNLAPASDQGGYAWISYFRSLAGLAPVQRNAAFEAGEAVHVRYLADHSLGCETDVHDELTEPAGGCPANPYASALGQAAALNSNITRVDAPITDRAAVSNWFVAGFHALTLLEPRLRSTGYAAYYTANPTGARPQAYPFTASVDVYRGRTGSYRGQTIAFPGNGAATPLLSYQVGSESPEPFRDSRAGSSCYGWGARSEVSAPIVMQWPVGSAAAQTGASIIDLTSGSTLVTCALTAADYPSGSLARQFLLGTNRLTQAALYYASTPFVAGHRYQLQIAGQPATTFSATDLSPKSN
ncbi:MAG: hypothetical protein ABI140_14125 [Jatrophihabitantaceae bacterium]